MEQKFKINDYVRYGSNGICEICDIKQMKFTHDSAVTTYYLLKPVSDSRSTLYVPQNNPVLMAKISPVLSKQDIDELIVSVGNQKISWVDDRIARNTEFQNILKNSDHRELIMLINCIYLKKLELESVGKKLCATDKSVLDKAERLIRNDFSFVLGVEENVIGEYICQKLGISGEERN